MKNFLLIALAVFISVGIQILIVPRAKPTATKVETAYENSIGIALQAGEADAHWAGDKRFDFNLERINQPGIGEADILVAKYRQKYDMDSSIPLNRLYTLN